MTVSYSLAQDTDDQDNSTEVPPEVKEFATEPTETPQMIGNLTLIHSGLGPILQLTWPLKGKKKVSIFFGYTIIKQRLIDQSARILTKLFNKAYRYYVYTSLDTLEYAKSICCGLLNIKIFIFLFKPQNIYFSKNKSQALDPNILNCVIVTYSLYSIFI